MAIGFVAVASTNPSGANTSVTAALPTGFAAGDLLVAYVTINKAATVTLPAGWTAADGPIAETAATSYALYRVADGSETGPVVSADTSGQWRMDIAAYRGVDGTTPLIAHGGQIESGGSAVVHSAPTLTNTDPGAWGVFAAAFRQVSTPSSWTPGSGLTERADADTGQSSTANTAQCLDDTNGPIAAGDWAFSASSSSGTAQATMWAGLLKPAAGGTPPNTGTGVAAAAATATGVGITSRSGSGVATAAATARGSGVHPALTVPRHTFIAVALAGDGTSGAVLEDAAVDAALTGATAEATVLPATPLTVILHTTD